MSVFEIGKDRYRVQVRRKGFPGYEQVFSTRQLAEAAQAGVMGGSVSSGNRKRHIAVRAVAMSSKDFH